MDVIKQRKSIRKYNNNPVSMEVVTELIKAATLAPNGSNSQQWDFIVVNKPELVDKLAEYVSSAHREYFGKARIDASEGEKLVKIVSMYENLKNVPVFVVFCVNMRNKMLQEEFTDYMKLWAEHSIAAAIENFILAATDKGLGTCWFGSPSWRSEQIKNLLNIPASIEIAAISPLGYPEGNSAQRPRMPIEEVMHVNHW